MSRQEYFLSKYRVPFRRAIRSSVGFQILLVGLLLCAANAAQAGSASPSGNDSKAKSGTATPQQLAVLYDEDPADHEIKRHAGSVVWRTETIQQTGEKPDLAVLADIEIPERNLRMTISIGGNKDLYLSASHRIEINFAVPSKSSEEAVGYVHGVAMRPSENERGIWLAGVEGKLKHAAEQVSEGHVVFRLSDRAYNQLQLMDELSRLDIYMNYNSGRWVFLTIESGASGREVFEKAFTAWKVQ